MLDEQAVDNLADRTITTIVAFDKWILTQRQPPVGPHAIFHHSSHAIERIRDIRLILRRLLVGRRELNEAQDRVWLAERDNWENRTESQAWQQAMHEQDDIGNHLRLDFESLYLFGHLFLEQWAHITARVVGINLSDRTDGAFTALYKRLEAGSEPALRSVWNTLRDDLIWLSMEVRFYRNRFITHANRPWQRGAIYGMGGLDFRLYVPSPPGWVDFDIQATVGEVWEKMPPSVTAGLPGDAVPADRLRRMRERVAELDDRELRAAVGRLYRELGGETPDFRTVGERLLRFAADGTVATRTVAEADPARIDLGPGAGIHRLPPWPWPDDENDQGDDTVN